MSNLTFAEWLGKELEKRDWRPAHFARLLSARGVTTAKQRLSYWLHPSDLPDELFPPLAEALGWTEQHARQLRAATSLAGFSTLVRARLGERGMKQNALVATLAAHRVRCGGPGPLNRWLSPQLPKREVIGIMLDLFGLNLDDDRETVLRVYALCGMPLPVREQPPPNASEGAAA